jgi:hypothetical protein
MSRFIAIDPGEDTGLSVWEDNKPVLATTVKMWDTADVLYRAFNDNRWSQEKPRIRPGYVNEYELEVPELSHVYEAVFGYEIDAIVCEDFRIYPWKAKDLAWDQVRTARLIGALTFIAKLYDIEFVLQGAKIKERAVAGGAEEFFARPLHENRHANDSIMHGVFYIQTELMAPVAA